MKNDRRVLAAPFRAHLNHVCASTGVDWAVVALHVGLPVGLVRDLLDTRPGRRVQRIAPELAQRVLLVTPETLQLLQCTTVPARASRRTLSRLAGAGWTRWTLAHRLRVPASELDALASGTLSEVTAHLEFSLLAVLATEHAPQTRPVAA